MHIIIICLIALFALAIVLKKYSKDTSNTVEGQKNASLSQCSTCSGDAKRCEQECMMEAATQPIEYFDDEELDRYKGREASSYNDEEVDEFAEVVHTMRETEVKDWCRSLTLRGINLPNQLKDEVFMLIEDSDK